MRAWYAQVADWTYRIAFGAFLTTSVLFFGCDVSPLAGVTAAYGDSGGAIAQGSSCNQQGTYYGGVSGGAAGAPKSCPHVYTPVCGDGVTNALAGEACDTDACREYYQDRYYNDTDGA